MGEKLRILILEDVATDAELMEEELRKDRISFSSIRVETEDTFRKELKDFKPDIILSNYSLSQFNGMSVLKIVREIAPTTPVIVVTNSINEEKAVECIKAGADDYVLKGNLIRLSPTIKGALKKKLLREQKDRAVAALKKSEEKFRDLYENSTLGIYRSTPEGRIIMANPAALSLLGYSSLEEILKTNVAVGYYDPLTRSKFEEILQRENKIYGFEAVWKRPDGTLIDIRESARVVTNEKGEVVYYEGVFEDITEKKKAEEALIKAKEEAEKLNRLKSSFLANMSHELRTPLTGILGFAEMLSDELQNPQHKDVVANIHLCGSQLLETINSIINFALIEADEVKLELINMDVAEQAGEIVNSVKDLASQKNLIVSTKIKSKNIFARLDEYLFRQILLNLLNNAMKYATNGNVIVEVGSVREKERKWAEVKVIDTGIGISKEDEDIIFREFRQASEGMERKFEGWGLGLTIVKRLTEIMDGEILFDSELNKGSTFTVRFPLVTKAQGVSKRTESDMEVTASTGQPAELPNVLLVENEISSVKITEFFLKDVYSIDYVDNGKDAIIMLIEKNYDAIIMDIDLAGEMDGMETTREIRKLQAYQHIPIIALTAYAMRGDEEKFIGSGCSYYMSKPFERDELIELMKEALGSLVKDRLFYRESG